MRVHDSWQVLNASDPTLETILETFLSTRQHICTKVPPLRQNSSACHFTLAFGGLQVRRAGALAVTKAVADKHQLEMLDLDANEIPDSALDDVKVRHLTYALLVDMAPPWQGSPVPLLVVWSWEVVQQSSSVLKDAAWYEVYSTLLGACCILKLPKALLPIYCPYIGLNICAIAGSIPAANAASISGMLSAT